jgi:nicotinamide mononucleotide transporter
MWASEIWHSFYLNIHATTWQEWVSFVFQIASVWFARKNNVLVYPTGIIGVVLAAYVYYFVSTPPLYADTILNIYYFAMSIYGWYFWTRKKSNEVSYPISWCNTSEIKIGLGLFLFFTGIIYLMLIKLTNSNTPILDTLVSSTAITAMWWMAKRKMENWIAWIVSNIIAIPLNFYKGFMLFTLMYILFLWLAVLGYKAWKIDIQSKKSV